MKTAISIPDEIFAEAEQLTRRLKKSRSQLYTEAVKEYLARHEQSAVTAALDRLADVEDSHADPAISAASRRLLERVEW